MQALLRLDVIYPIKSYDYESSCIKKLNKHPERNTQNGWHFCPVGKYLLPNNVYVQYTGCRENP